MNNLYIYTTSSMSGFTPTPVCWQHSVNPFQCTPASDTTCNSPTWYDFVNFPHQLLTPCSHDASSRPGFSAILIHRWHLVSHFHAPLPLPPPTTCPPGTFLAPYHQPLRLHSPDASPKPGFVAILIHMQHSVSSSQSTPCLCHHWQLAPLVWS